MSDRIVGTCSACGGAVTMSSTWFGTQPQIPSCRSCHGTPKNPYGPVVEIQPGPLCDKKLLLENR
jgi:hypothetical protein